MGAHRVDRKVRSVWESNSNARNRASARSPFSPSIDRIIPTLGYTKGNCRFILHALNALKGSGTDEQALAIAGAFVLTQRDRS
jgi:hypothetical protein